MTLNATLSIAVIRNNFQAISILLAENYAAGLENIHNSYSDCLLLTGRNLHHALVIGIQRRCQTFYDRVTSAPGLLLANSIPTAKHTRMTYNSSDDVTQQRCTRHLHHQLG